MKATTCAVLVGSLAAIAVAGEFGKDAEPDAQHKGYVVLVHGMGRTPRSMRRMKKSLNKRGYEVVSFGYSSRKEELGSIVERLDETIRVKCVDVSNEVNYVTHSLGGIIVRCYLRDHKDSRTGRVVMLSPPNRGSELVDAFRDFRIYQRFTGEAGQQLGTGTNDLPRELGPVDFELGVITGDRSLNPFYSSIVEGRDDGKVSIENARVTGMTDFLVMHSSHTFIMRRKSVIEQVMYFLENGEFLREGDE